MQENDYPVMLKCGGMFFEVPAGIMNSILTVDSKMTPWGNCFECRYETVFGRVPKKIELAIVHEFLYGGRNSAMHV